MAKYIREIMNPELFSVEPESPRDLALDFILALGIHACPVIDELGLIKGMVSIPDLMSGLGGNRVIDRVREPAVTIPRDASIADGARKLAEQHVHRLVAVDEKGRAVGMVSAVDLVAALSGVPVTHPAGFARVDEVAGLSWSQDRVLEPEQSEEVPSEPGVLVLVYGRPGSEEVPVWIEEARDLRARLDAILDLPQDDQPQLAHLLERDRGHLRFRVAIEPDAARRAAAARALSEHARGRQRIG